MFHDNYDGHSFRKTCFSSKYVDSLIFCGRVILKILFIDGDDLDNEMKNQIKVEKWPELKLQLYESNKAR